MKLGITFLLVNQTWPNGRVGCEFLFKPPSVAEMTGGSMTSSGSHPDELPAGVRYQLLEQALVP